MNNRKAKIIVIAVLFAIVSILSIGYAVLSARLKISGMATVPGGKCDAVFVEAEKSVETSGSAKCEFGEITKTSITGLKAIFTKPGDSCTFTIPAKNDGNMVNYLADVVGKNTSLTFEGSGDSALEDEELLKNFVVYEVKYGETKIDNSTDFSSIPSLESGGQKTVTLKIEFSYEATAVPKSAVNVSGLDRTFVYSCGRINSEGDFSPQCEDGKLLTPTPVSTPNAPVLDSNMIPVYYEKQTDTTGVWKKADEDNTNNEWYDYNKQKWANAVTVIEAQRTLKDAEAGTEIPMDAINTMWVWIPRYSYTIKSEDGENYYGKRSSCEETPSQELPGEIDVKFVDKNTTDSGTAQYTGNTATNWRTNEAFNFDGKPHDGIWVGKFETTGTLSKNGQGCTDTNCEINNITIKPGEVSLINQTVSSLFYAARSMQKEGNQYGFSLSHGDLHMIKNDEWGAVAYLSQSKYGKYGNSDYTGANKEVYQNKSSEYKTGSSNGTPSQDAYKEGTQYTYNDMTDLGQGRGSAGPGASTTGTIYGIYDMSGGTWDCVMGVLEYDKLGVSINEGKIVAYSSGFVGLNKDGLSTGTVSLPDEKYYNKYKTELPTSSAYSNALTACNGEICYGHALSETSGWYKGQAAFINYNGSWFTRGGGYFYNTAGGIFNASYGNGGDSSSRYIFTL